MTAEKKWPSRPWGLSEGVNVWVMAGSLHVATIPRAMDGDWSRANAHLIAAAPELYEALEAMTSFAKAKLDDPSRAGEMMLFQKSEATLAKARGQS